MSFLLKLFFVGLILLSALSVCVKADTMIAVMSPHHSKEEITAHINLLRSWLLRLPQGDSIIVLDGWNGHRLAHLMRPKDKKYQAPKTVVLYNRQAFSKLVQFAKSRSLPKRTLGTLHIPKLMRDVSLHYPAVEEIILIGSASFDLPSVSEHFVEGTTYPTDDNLTHSSHEKPYGIRDVPQRLSGKRFHWLLPHSIEPYKYALAVKRFYHMYLDGQRGKLVSFSADADLVSERLFNKAAAMKVRYEMNATSSPVSMNSLFTRTPSVNAVVSSDQHQTVRLGIIWQKNVDLDIYGLLKGEIIPVYFKHQHSPYAKHHKDIRRGHDRQATYEIITYQKPINVCELRIGINHYGGNASQGVSGTLRIEIGDALIAKPFSFSAHRGNHGRDIMAVLKNGTATLHSQRFLLRDVADIKGCA